MLGIMLVTLPVVYAGTSFLAWWLLSLTRRWLLAIVATLALFAWSHLIGTANDQRLVRTQRTRHTLTGLEA